MQQLIHLNSIACCACRMWQVARSTLQVSLLDIVTQRPTDPSGQHLPTKAVRRPMRMRKLQQQHKQHKQHQQHKQRQQQSPQKAICLVASCCLLLPLLATLFRASFFCCLPCLMPAIGLWLLCPICNDSTRCCCCCCCCCCTPVVVPASIYRARVAAGQTLRLWRCSPFIAPASIAVRELWSCCWPVASSHAGNMMLLLLLLLQQLTTVTCASSALIWSANRCRIAVKQQQQQQRQRQTATDPQQHVNKIHNSNKSSTSSSSSS